MERPYPPYMREKPVVSEDFFTDHEDSSDEKSLVLEKVKEESLPETKTVKLSEDINWKLRAFQNNSERFKALVKAAHVEFQMKQLELKNSLKELQEVVDEAKASIKDQVHEKYEIREFDPVEGVALCQLKKE